MNRLRISTIVDYLLTGLLSLVAIAAAFGVGCPYTARLTYFMAALKFVAALGFFMDKKPEPISGACAHWFSNLCALSVIVALAAGGWFVCATCWTLNAIGYYNRQIREETKTHEHV